MGRELMEIVTGEISRLDALITDFLGFASPREPLVCRTDLGALARETATLLRQSHQTSWQVEVREKADLPVVAEVDPDLVRQVFWNLSRNAIEAMPGKGGLLEIIVAAVDDTVSVAFADNGGGIPAAAIPKILHAVFLDKRTRHRSRAGDRL